MHSLMTYNLASEKENAAENTYLWYLILSVTCSKRIVIVVINP